MQEDKVYISDGLLLQKVKIDVDKATDQLDWTKHSIAANIAPATICMRCAICAEDTPMSENDYRTYGVYVCDKCKAAVMHIRSTLENT